MLLRVQPGQLGQPLPKVAPEEVAALDLELNKPNGPSAITATLDAVQGMAVGVSTHCNQVRPATELPCVCRVVDHCSEVESPFWKLGVAVGETGKNLVGELAPDCPLHVLDPGDLQRRLP